MIRRLLALALLVLAPPLGLAACSDDDGGTVGTDDVTTTSDPDVETGDITPTTEAGGDAEGTGDGGGSGMAGE